MSQAQLPYHQSANLLQSYDIPIARATLVTGLDQVAHAAEAIGFPIALKLLVPRASHKSDAGLVWLNLQDDSQVRQAAATLEKQAQSLPAIEGGIEGFLVQEMVSGGVELIVGSNTDPQFGPVLMLGAGGIWVELINDIALRLPPLTNQSAQAMIDEIRAARLLKGYRNQPPADLLGLRWLLLRVARLIVEQSDWLDSLDFNPVIVLPAGQGVKVVDFRLFSRVGNPGAST